MTTNTMRRGVLAGLGGIALASMTRPVLAKSYDTGASDSEIKLGSTAPYSGPASAWAFTVSARWPTSRWSTSRVASMGAM